MQRKQQKPPMGMFAIEPCPVSEKVCTISLRGIEKKDTTVLRAILTDYRLLFRAKIEKNEDVIIYLPLKICEKTARSSDKMKQAQVAIFYGCDDDSCANSYLEIYPAVSGERYHNGGGLVEINRNGCPIYIAFLPIGSKSLSTYGGIPFAKVLYCDRN